VWNPLFSEDKVRCMRKGSDILDEDAKSDMNLSKVVMETRKGDPLHVIKEIQDHQPTAIEG
jgi:hypothetical protein